MKQVMVWTIVPLLMLVVSGCTLKATFKETTDTTSNITGTTSGRTWFTEDGMLNPEHKLTAFATFNQENVEQDLARGQGEYATSVPSWGCRTTSKRPFTPGRKERFRQS